MNDQLLGILRALLAAGGGWAVGKGYIDNATATTAAGALLTLGTAAWSYWSNSQAAKIKSINDTPNGLTVVPAKAAQEAGIPQADVPIPVTK